MTLKMTHPQLNKIKEKLDQIAPYLVLGGLVLIAAIGVFDAPALNFVTDVSEKNLGFLGLVAELKLIIGGLGDLNIPFINGHSGEVTESLDKAENYLLAVNVISFAQVMFMAISKSWMVKVGLAVLFVATFIGKTKVVSTKLLIISLAFFPGLSIFSVGVSHLAQSASIDFGTGYLKQLEQSVHAIRAENTQLMQEHAKNQTEINNGKKGVVFLKKFKEDVSYDFKKARNDIKGDYKAIRVFMHGAGKEVISKSVNFCTMILFCMLLLPIGYSLLVYTLFKSI